MHFQNSKVDLQDIYLLYALKGISLVAQMLERRRPAHRRNAYHPPLATLPSAVQYEFLSHLAFSVICSNECAPPGL